MDIQKRVVEKTGAVKFEAIESGKVVGRAYLYFIYNDLHAEPYGFVEDVFVEESQRGKGTGNALLKALLGEAKEHECYKVLATSRDERQEIHAWYERLGFRKYGFEFRIDL